MQLKVNKLSKPIFGEIKIPSDKSISHRAIMLSSLAKGKSVIRNFSNGQDPITTMNIFKNFGIDISRDENSLTIISQGKLIPSESAIYCGNSGTTMRLLSGILAGQDFDSILTGDESLSNRPMKRIIEPLELMGGKIISNEGKAPLKIFSSSLNSIDYHSKIASAQVKSCILLAGLNAQGTTSITEPYVSRNHSELMLKHMGADIFVDQKTVKISKSTLSPIEIDICADISSAAYFIVGALIVPNSKIIIKNVGLNPTRTGIINIAKKMGASITILDKHTHCEEEIGDILVEYSENLKGCEIKGEIIPTLIDEIPIITVLATQAQGQTIIKDAQDLRNKESDRIKAMVNELKKLGADIIETQDGMIINGKTNLKGNALVESYNDHRIAMSLYVAGLICQKEILINNFEWVNISFPNFEQLMFNATN